MDVTFLGLHTEVFASEILWGLLAGVFQILGYMVYIKLSQDGDEGVDPNPATWLMFSYGTTVLAFLEWRFIADEVAEKGGVFGPSEFAILFLPIACALLSIRVATICWKRGKLRIPREAGEVIPFAIDICLTVAYVGVWFATTNDALSEHRLEELTLLFLVLSNMSTCVSFAPIVQNTWKSPQDERALPWFIWTSAYAMHGIATYLDEKTLWTPLIMYPASCVVLHGLMALLALRKPHLPAPLRS